MTPETTHDLRRRLALCGLLAFPGCASSVVSTAPDARQDDALLVADRLDATTTYDAPDAPPVEVMASRDDASAEATVDVAPVDAPRDVAPLLVAPLSGTRVTRGRPTLRWRRAAGVSDVRVEISRDREGRSVVQQFVVSGDAAQPRADAPELTPGVYFWRVRSLRDGMPDAIASATWQFVVPARSADVDTAWGIQTDVNGDGVADFIEMGVSDMDGGYGSVRFVQGPLGAAPLAPTRELAASRVYVAVVVGDVDGDGWVDLALRRTCTDGGGTDRVDIHRGGAGGPSPTAAFTVRWSGFTCQAGRPVVGVGDVNGDGYGDLVVESPETRGFLRRDEVYWGGSTGPARTADEVVEGGSEYTGLRRPVALGDVNGDGFADVAFTETAGYVHGDPLALIPARVRVYLGSARGLTASAPVVLTSPRSHDPGFAAALVGSVDLNGDGLADMLVDAFADETPDSPAARRVYVYPGARTFTASVSPNTILPRPNDTGYDGGAFVGGGDLDGDGFDDLVLAADVRAGVHVQAMRGGAAGLATAPTQSFVRTGASVHAAFTSAWNDFNRDGRADVILSLWLPGGGVPATGSAVDALWGRAFPLDENPQHLR